MLRLPSTLCIVYFFATALVAHAAQWTEVGAYWAFQVENGGVGPTNATFTEIVSVNTWPSGTPSFSYAGTRKTNQGMGNYGANQTAFDGSVWVPGRAFGWYVSNTGQNNDPSTGNSFEITLDTTGIEDLNVELRYRLNGTQTTSGQQVDGFSAFEYRLDGGVFTAVPGISLGLEDAIVQTGNNAGSSSYNNFWQADLSSLPAIENAGLITLRWTLPDLAAGNSKQIRMDDLEVTGSYSPITYTELLELRTSVGTYTPSTFTASAVDYGLSGADAADFDISSSGELTFINAPVYSSQANYEIVVEMSDPSDSSRIEHETVSVTILPSAAITTRDRHHPIGEYNVLFIPVDDLRPLLNVYGEDDPLRPITINGESGTPNFDRLAASGVTFLNAHCQQAICTASRVSFLTGLRPDTTRNWNLETNFRDIMPNVVTLPQQFNQSGYKTYGVGKIFHGQTSSKQDDDHSAGADSWSEGWQNPSTGRFNFYERGDNNSVWNTWDKTAVANSSSVSATDVGEYKRDGVTKIEDSDYKDGRAAELAVEKIAEYAIDGTPFFLGLGFQKPHLPFNAPKDYWDLYDPDAIDMSFYQGVRDMPEGTNSFTSPYGGEPSSYGDGETYLPTVAEPDLSIFFNDRMPSVDSARHLIHGYMACVSFIDAQLGKVLDALEDPNGDGSDADSIADNTIVILFGDHGFHLGDHGAFWAKHSNYEISTRVPFIIRSPGMSSLGSRGKMTSAPVELVDIFPTLLDLCSLPIPSTTTRITAENDTELYQVLEGTSLVPLLEDPEQPWKSVAFSQYQRYISYKSSYDSDRPLSAAGGGKGMGYSIRTDRYRYTEWWKTNGDYGKFGTNTYDPDASRVVAGQASFVELYDYHNDPLEAENLAYTQASTYAALISELQGLLHDSDSSDYVGDGWKKDMQTSPYNVPASYPVTKSHWASLHQSPGRNPSEFADTEDPDQDGIINLMEYAMGTHPLKANNNQVSVFHTSGSIGLLYPQVSVRDDVTIVPETTGSLNTNSWSPVTSTVTDTIGSKTIKEASLTTSGASGFLRLRVE